MADAPTSNCQYPLIKYFEVPNKSVTFLILIWDFSYLQGALLEPTCLFVLEKNSHLHCFLRNKYKKIPPTRPYLLISAKTSYLHSH